MTNEEMQKAMDFIMELPAKTAVKLDCLSENVDAIVVSRERNEKKWERTEEGIRALVSIAEIREREIATLSDNGRATDERLNTLINVVERQTSKGRNGKP
jgi:hypothetical protein